MRRFGGFGFRLRGISAIGMGAALSRLRTTTSNWVFGTLGCPRFHRIARWGLLPLSHYSAGRVKRFCSSALRICGSRGFARAITIRENEAKILHPTRVREAIRFESAKSADRIWHRPSNLMALQITSGSSKGSAGKYIESVRMNLNSTFIFADTSGSPSRISFMRSSAAHCRLPGMRSQEELRTTYFGAPVTRSPRKYADSVEITSPCKNVKSSSGSLNPRALVSSDKIGERTMAPEALRTAILSRESFIPAANCLIAVSAASL